MIQGTNASNGNEVKVAEQPNIRRDFYQTDSDFVLNIMAKNVDPKQVQISFGPQTVRKQISFGGNSNLLGML